MNFAAVLAIRGGGCSFIRLQKSGRERPFYVSIRFHEAGVVRDKRRDGIVLLHPKFTGHGSE